MKLYRIPLAASILCSLLWGNISAYAEEYPEYSSPSEIPLVLLEKFGNTYYEENYISNVLNTVRQYGKNKLAITAEQIKETKSIKINKLRKENILNTMYFDKDSDGIISPDEYKKSLEIKSSRQKAMNQQIAFIKRADKNNDGTTTTQEVVALVDEEFEKDIPKRHHNIYTLTKFLALDTNGDNQITVKELKKVARKAFYTIDTNNDGILTENEKKNLKHILYKKQTLKKIALSGCKLPKPKKHEKVIFINVAGGLSTSNYTLVGQGKATNAIPLKISHGDEKLYIIASSASPTIWQLQGNIDRISNLVLAGPSVLKNTKYNKKINAGVTNIPENKVTFHHIHECGLTPSRHHTPAKKNTMLKALDTLLGQQPDLFLRKDYVTGIHIFGERINTDISKEIANAQQQTPEGFDEKLWKKHIKAMPGGLTNFKDEKIFSESPLAPYEVLPGWAGYSKLAAEGAIIIPTKVGYLKLVKSIPHYPPIPFSRHGAFDYGAPNDILIGIGIKPPKGNPEHTIVTLEETGEVISGSKQNIIHIQPHLMH